MVKKELRLHFQVFLVKIKFNFTNFFVNRTVGDIVPTLVNKCLSGRPKIKERAFDILLMYIEIDKNAEIEDELIKGLETKQPKIVQASLELLRRALR